MNPIYSNVTTSEELLDFKSVQLLRKYIKSA